MAVTSGEPTPHPELCLVTSLFFGEELLHTMRDASNEAQQLAQQSRDSGWHPQLLLLYASECLHFACDPCSYFPTYMPSKSFEGCPRSGERARSANGFASDGFRQG